MTGFAAKSAKDIIKNIVGIKYDLVTFNELDMIIERELKINVENSISKLESVTKKFVEEAVNKTIDRQQELEDKVADH